MNSEMNLFNPVDLELSRSTFEFHPSRTGTATGGRLIPVFQTEILPGDSVKMDVRTLFKMSTPVYPTMDQLYADVFFFFVPNRLVLSRRYGAPSATDGNASWAAIMGAQDNLIGAPIPASGLHVPTVRCTAKAKPGTLNDYFFGCCQTFPSGGQEFSVLPWLSYFAIWNDNFRDESTMTPVVWDYNASFIMTPQGNVPLYATSIEISNSNRTAIAGNYALVNALGSDNDGTGSAVGGSHYWLPFPVCRFHGFFGSALPWPQRNIDGVELPLGEVAPIVTGADLGTSFATGADAMIWRSNNNGALITGRTGITLASTTGNTQAGSTGTVAAGSEIVPANLYADLSSATAANVNALRAAIQKQRWYEKLARSGNRFDELEYGLFGVRPHDSGLDRPLYLGGKRIPLSVEMVASTNGASGGELGNLGAFSHTNDNDHYFYHSFDEWGTLMCCFCIRHHDSFGSGLDPALFRLTRDDFYFPTFAHLGEMSLKKKLISSDSSDNTPFGYQQAWEDYRQNRDFVTGYCAPGQSYQFMTYATDFGSSPTLATFLNASYQVVSIDQTLQTKSYSSGFQFVYQFTFDYTMRRCMPTYSVPGLMDHF